MIERVLNSISSRVARVLVTMSLAALTAACESEVNKCKTPAGEEIACPTAGGGDGATPDTTAGTDSTDGSDGGDGTDGAADGTNGADGTDGSDSTTGTDGSSGPSCSGFCGDWLGEGAACHCDEQCIDTGDCCTDYETVCASEGDGTDRTDGTDGVQPVYAFPAPFDTALLNEPDCRGIASSNASDCDTDDCRGIARWEKSYCNTDDCDGIASANPSACDSANCKGIARGRKCELEDETCLEDADDSNAKDACETTLEACLKSAATYCDDSFCKAIVNRDPGDCPSNDRSCRAIARRDKSYCF